MAFPVPHLRPLGHLSEEAQRLSSCLLHLFLAGGSSAKYMAESGFMPIVHGRLGYGILARAGTRHRCQEYPLTPSVLAGAGEGPAWRQNLTGRREPSSWRVSAFR